VRSAEAGAARILHVATHGHAAPVDPGASGLLLAADSGGDGFLTAREIRTLSLTADLVVLSACETGAGRIVGGQGVLGLARAFLDAGATGVVASLWRVDDAATAAFMERFYRHLAADVSPAASLARAKREDPVAGRGFVFFGAGDEALGLPVRPYPPAAAPPRWAWPVLGLAVAGALAAGRRLREARRRVASGAAGATGSR